jgi:hypothetical protein
LYAKIFFLLLRVKKKKKKEEEERKLALPAAVIEILIWLNRWYILKLLFSLLSILKLVGQRLMTVYWDVVVESNEIDASSPSDILLIEDDEELKESRRKYLLLFR